MVEKYLDRELQVCKLYELITNMRTMWPVFLFYFVPALYPEYKAEYHYLEFLINLLFCGILLYLFGYMFFSQIAHQKKKWFDTKIVNTINLSSTAFRIKYTGLFVLIITFIEAIIRIKFNQFFLEIFNINLVFVFLFDNILRIIQLSK